MLATSLQNRLNNEEAAKYLECSVSSLNAMRSKGTSPVYYKPNKAVFYLKEDLDAYLLRNRVESKKGAL